MADEKDLNQNPQEQPIEPVVVDANLGNIEARSVVEEMSTSYLDYAMSVIVSRALPDARDGLKPVHRRILYAMNEMKLGPKAKHTKSANIVGEVLGKFHPHGDSAVYDSLARMAQDFSHRYPLINGQGNFGSMDGDSPAAMRYTEAKMQSITEKMLDDIEKDTVDFTDNYDATRKEPRYLPTRVPGLLLNGSLGIAVGMATNIPPHNLRELISGTKALIDNPEISIEELCQHIPGPDFPTGATIFGKDDIMAAYAAGKGKIVIRAEAKIEERTKPSGFRIIVTSIPFQVNKADLVAKIADLVKNKKIEGITDLRDESDRKEKVRIVIELRSNAYPKKVLNKLYSLTQMQTAFHMNMIALHEGIQPKVYTLKEALQAFVAHRILVVRRRTQFELKKAQHRAHILEGLKQALDFIDAIITTIRGSKTREVAHTALMKDFNLSDIQANAILEMRLAALAGLERQKVLDELEEKRQLIAYLTELLGSEEKIKEVIKEELTEVGEVHGDDRKTKIVAHRIGEFRAEDLIPNEQVVITLTDANYIKSVPIDAYKAQKRGGKGISGMTTKEQDMVKSLRVADTHDEILFFTSKGRLFKSKVYEIPKASRQAKGTPIVNLIQLGSSEVVTAMITLNEKRSDGMKYFFMGTRDGVVKKTEVAAYKNVRQTGIIAMKLRGDDQLQWVRLSSGENQILMVTQNGQGILYSEKDVRPMGRSASGVRGIKLRQGDEVIAVSMIRGEGEENLLTVSENGFGKRTSIKLFKQQKRGGYGIRAARVSSKTGNLVSAQVIAGNDGEVVMVSISGQTIRLTLKSIKKLGRDTQGVTLMRFKGKAEKVASMTYFQENEKQIEAAAQEGAESKTDEKAEEKK